MLRQLKQYARKISYLLSKVPGEARFGLYRFVPLFFLFGASLEYTMIHWRPSGQNFYDTFIRRKVHETAVKQLQMLGELGEDVTDI